MSRNRIRQKRYNGGSPAEQIVLYAFLMLAVVALNGCHGDNDHHDHSGTLPTYYTEILSDESADGDIGLTLDGTFSVSTAIDTGSVLAGVDPVTGEEFRGFLDFPLGGVDGIPLDAVIGSATLKIFIIGIYDSPPDGVLPFLIDLVDFQPPFLIEDDFSRTLQPSLLTKPVDFYPSDVGSLVVIDVTDLVDEAQFLELPDLQLRLLLDFSADSGLIEIGDADIDNAPLLSVTYH